jgi:hypothetical protein
VEEGVTLDLLGYRCQTPDKILAPPSNQPDIMVVLASGL